MQVKNDIVTLLCTLSENEIYIHTFYKYTYIQYITAYFEYEQPIIVKSFFFSKLQSPLHIAIVES